jgi:hypothetical protein
MDRSKEQRESILRAARAAREYEFAIDGRTFKLLMPSSHEGKIAFLRGGGSAEPAVWVNVQRIILTNALVGWSGVTEADLLRNGSDKPVPFHEDLVPVLFDAQGKWYEALWDDLSPRYNKRDDDLDAEKKSSETSSIA